MARAFDDIVPLRVLREGFFHEGRRVSFGSFMKGIHRGREQRGPAALTLVTVAPKPGHAPPYDDLVDPDAQTIVYHYRSGSPDQPDNRALRAALDLQAPLIYFRGIDPGQYQVIAPVFVTEDDLAARMVRLQVGLWIKDAAGAGIVSLEETRRYRLTEVAQRYHQARFRRDVLRAYSGRCAVCALREVDLIEAAHIVRDSHPRGIAAVVNGMALCAIHHLAYDRNLLGVDPAGVVHIGSRLLAEEDGPMLRMGLQGFHGAAIMQPRRPELRPDPNLLELRFEEFTAAA